MSYFVEQLAMLLGVSIEPARIILLVQALSDLNESQVRLGFEQARKLFKPEYGRTFPSPAEIRKWAEEWRPTEGAPQRKFKSIADIDPAKCPKGWSQEEVFRAHLTQQKSREKWAQI